MSKQSPVVTRHRSYPSMVMGWLGYMSYPTEYGEAIDGRRALSVSNTHPTFTGNPPEAVMSEIDGILNIKQTKQRELETIHFTIQSHVI